MKYICTYCLCGSVDITQILIISFIIIIFILYINNIKKIGSKKLLFLEFLAYFSGEEERRITLLNYEEVPESYQCRMIAFSQEKFLILDPSPRWPAWRHSRSVLYFHIQMSRMFRKMFELLERISQRTGTCHRDRIDYLIETWNVQISFRRILKIKLFTFSQN